MATESRARGHAETSGASPTVWAIFFSSLAISTALVVEGSVRIEPNWQRWWGAILGLEVSAYTLTLFLPPLARVNLIHALCRLAVGMLMRLFVVALCALLLVVGGESDLIGGLKLFWAAHWPAAIGEIACVAAAVYCFRVIAMRRAVEHREAPVPVAPPPFATRSHDELLEELMSDRSGGEAVVPTEVATAEPAPAETQPSLPETGEAPVPPVAPPPELEQPDVVEPEVVAHAGEASAIQEPISHPETLPTFPVTEPSEAIPEAPPAVGVERATAPEDELPETPVDTAGPPAMEPVQAPPAELLQGPPVVEELGEFPPPAPEPPLVTPQPEPVLTSSMDEPETVAEVEPQPSPGEPLPTAPMLGELTIEQAVEPEEPVQIEAEPVAEPSPTAETPAEPVAVAEVTPEQAAVAEPTEDQAQPPVPVADPTTTGALKLPGEVLLDLLPAELLNRPAEEVVERLPERSFSFEWETIAPQLERGEVRVPGATLLGQMPREVLAASAGEFLNTLPAEGIELPLSEIVARLPLDFFAAPPDQAAPEALTDEPPIFREDSDGPAPQPRAEEAPVAAVPPASPAPPPVDTQEEPAPQPPAEEAPVAAAPPASPALAVDTQEEPAPVEEPAAAPVSAEIPEAAPSVTVSPGEPETAADQPPTDQTGEERLPEPSEAAQPPIVTPPRDPMDQPEEEAPTDAATPLLQTPPNRVGEQVISSAIAALQKKRSEEEEEDEAEERASAEHEAADVAPAAPASDAEAPAEAAPPSLQPLSEHQPPPAAEQETSPVEEEAPPAQVSYDEPQAALAPEPAMAEQASAPEEEAPLAEPELARVTIDAGIEDDLRAALKGVDCRGVELLWANGASIVVAHSSPEISAEQADNLAELVRSSRHIVAHTDAGSFSSALLIGTQATTFVGSPDNPRAPQLVVAINNASAGQATVAARKAMAVLESVEIAERPCEDALAGPPDGQPVEDERLRRIAAIVGQQAGGFRSQDGFGVVASGFEAQPTPETAAASEAVWKAAQRAQPGGADRLLVMGSTRTLGLAPAEGAGALVVAGFAPGMNPGLVGTETAKIVRMCNDSARKEGMPGDVG